MSKPLRINSTEETPEINFDPNAGVFKIIGCSYPENSQEFFTPIFDCIELYSQDPNDISILEIGLDYFNSSSIKQVFQLMYIMEDILGSGKEAKVIWRCKKEDELMFQKGKEFQNFLDVPVEVVVY